MSLEVFVRKNKGKLGKSLSKTDLFMFWGDILVVCRKTYLELLNFIGISKDILSMTAA